MKKIFASAAVFAAISSGAIAQHETQANLLLTRPGVEFGVQASHYHYEEPELIDITGNRGSVMGAYTLVNPEQSLFTRMDARVSYGSLKYEGSGTRSGIPDWLIEARIVAGKDFLLPRDSVSLSPYLGLGYRFLYNDLRGYNTVGNTTFVGYRRYANYIYIPVGLTSRIRTGEQWVLAPTLEYDAFLWGRQISMLSDDGLGDNNLYNTQHGGYGYRVSIMAESRNWAFGPWMNYWHIRASDLQRVNPTHVGLEPLNWTREAGFEIRYRF